ncbi:SCO7613 C-terminal domain-containing membrane protein [Nocardioides sp. T2.26MG-1]|uniref:SCO7613 C-terminal domain-containing membrane protein n=1 Tax=Nocardioides sp. T2.26MG-1 TaxID=3041166 RepID=UPI00254233B7|nr:hypothetical protein [Nocardioides sp. T2.26MG-1]
MTSTARTTRYSDPFVCPDCSARLPLQVTSCPGCGLRLNVPLASELLQTLRTADDLLARLRAESTDSSYSPFPAFSAEPTEPTEPHGVSALSVPKILLGLGALCLLVAAVIFLAVAWSWLGIGGRTAVLVALTLVGGGLGVWLGRRGLRVAAEALTTVGLGLLALDVVGADNAGWLGSLDGAGLTCAVGGTVLVVALALAQVTRLGAPQVLAALALSVLGAGAMSASGHVTTVIVAVVLGYLVLAAAARLGSLRLGTVLAAVGAGWWWVTLVAVGLDDAAGHPSLHGLWAEGYGAGLLAASLLLLVPVPAVRRDADTTRVLVAGAASLLTLTASLPAVDEGATVLGTVALVALVGWTVVSLALPQAWRPVARVPMLLAALPVLAVTAGLVVQATGNVLGEDDPFTRGAGLRLGEPDTLAAPALLVLGTCGLLLALISLTPRPTAVRPQAPAGVLLAAAIATLALFPVPLVLVTAALLLLGANVLAEAVLAGSRRHDDRYAQAQALVGVGLGVVAVGGSLPSDVLTSSAAAVLVAMTAIVAWRGTTGELRAIGGALLPAALAGLVWSVASVADAEQVQHGVPALLAVGVLAILVPRVELELSAALAGIAASLGALAGADDLSVALAVHLTVAGVLVSASALVHPQRRGLGWAGGLLLAAATWVRLADLGVTAPEAYTLPSAVALLLVGLHRLWRDPRASTAEALTPGLVLATVPSLLWVLADPLTWRAVLLGAGCLLLVLAGTWLRWNVPLLVGATVGTLVVLRELAPYAAQTPQWVLIGAAGTLLTVVGITWERRLRDLHTASAYLARLR